MPAMAAAARRVQSPAYFFPVAEDLCGDLPTILIHTGGLDLLLDLR
jgi:hypothetical protein